MPEAAATPAPSAAAVVANATGKPASVAAKPAPAAAPPPPSKPTQADPRFLAAVQKEKALRTKELSIKKAADELAQKQSQIAKDLEEAQALKKWKETASADPDTVAKGLWGDKYYDLLTKHRLGNGADLAVQQLRKELAAEKESAAKQAAAAAEAQKAQVEKERAEASADFNREISDFVSEHAKEYELTSTLKSAQLIRQVIELTYSQHGKVLSTKEAADQVEKYLEEQIEGALATPKLSAKWKKAEAAAEAAGKPPPKKPIEPAAPTQARSLSNDMSASTPTTEQGAGAKRLSRNDRIARAREAWALTRARQGAPKG